ncbi:MAG: glycosyltransferase family 1 protein [Cyclonatronaceae bacterium]
MRQLRIAIVTGNYNHIRDGVSNTLNRLVAHLEKRGFQVLVFGPWAPEPAMEHEGTFVPVYSIPAPGRPEYRISLGLPSAEKQKLRDFKPDLMHIATPDLLGFRALRLAMKEDIPVVSSYHTHFSSYLKYYSLGILKRPLWVYLHWFYRNCQHLYVPSPSLLEELEREGVACDLRLWARGVDTSLFNPAQRDMEWRRSLGFSDDERVIVFVSRLVWEKNLDMVAGIFSRIGEIDGRVRTLVVGDGPAREKLAERIPDTVFTGFLTGQDLARAYASSDIFFFPSDTESFGNVTLEAMSSGLPAVVARAPGNISLVEDGSNGYQAGVNDRERFMQCLVDIIRDPKLQRNMAEKALEKARTYDWEHILDQLVQHYREVLPLQDYVE